MRRYRRWAGNPSFRLLAERCAHMCSAATFHGVLNGTELPKFTVLNAFVIACGGDEEEFQRWATAWRCLDQEGAGPAPSPVILLPPPDEQEPPGD
ncbi:MAG: hypothetical protein M0026_09560 [Nocardiopsaceae bacterium]|nr:hypothetical protein [Nocardiopsaceae bacterium]